MGWNGFWSRESRGGLLALQPIETTGSPVPSQHGQVAMGKVTWGRIRKVKSTWEEHRGFVSPAPAAWSMSPTEKDC